MSTHQHHWHPTVRLALSLPDTAQRFKLLSVFACTACGATDTFTSWSRTTGRHLTREELRAVLRRERMYGQGKARAGLEPMKENTHADL